MAASGRGSGAGKSGKGRTVVGVECPGSPRAAASFDRNFVIGAERGCDVVVPGPGVAARHAEVAWDGVLWWIRGLSDAEGLWVDGARTTMRPLRDRAVLRLGAQGPEVHLRVSSGAVARATPPAGPAPTEAELLRRFTRPVDPSKAGPETQLFLRAVARASERSGRRYQVALAVVVLVALAAGVVLALQAQRGAQAEQTAVALFYASRTLELEIGRLSEAVGKGGDPARAAELAASKARFQQLERDYDRFVRELGVYTKAPPEERAIRSLARRLGECDLNVPASFVEEVRRYVERWKSGGRLAALLERAARKGYGPGIQQALDQAGLPPHFAYLPMQESGFEERAIGPATRSGFAKGLWQFIPATAHRYGLRVGPRFEEAVYDPEDERFQWEKATGAAVRYLKDLHQLEAQGSSLLVMASYNWGEHSVERVVASTPGTPSELNFWKVLQRREVPRETYDYVLSIFSAAVICEQPKVFGFDGQCLHVPAPEGG